MLQNPQNKYIYIYFFPYFEERPGSSIGRTPLELTPPVRLLAGLQIETRSSDAERQVS